MADDDIQEEIDAANAEQARRDQAARSPESLRNTAPPVIDFGGRERTDPTPYDGLSQSQMLEVVRTWNRLYGASLRTYPVTASGVEAFRRNVYAQRSEIAGTLLQQADSRMQVGRSFEASGGRRMSSLDMRRLEPQQPAPSSRTSTGNRTPQLPPTSASRDQYLAALNDSQGKAEPFLDTIIQAAAQRGIPWQVLYGVVRAEFNFDGAQMRRAGRDPVGGRMGAEEGANPTRTIVQLSLDLAKLYERYGDWALAALAHKHPESAQHIFESADGSSAPGRAMLDTQWVSKVFSGLDALGLDVNEMAGVSLFAQGGAKGAGGGGASNPFNRPDPAAVREQARTYLRQLFFREPTDAELEGIVNLLNGVVDQANTEAQAANGVSNPFRELFAGEDGTARGLAVNPLEGGERTSGYGMRDHPVHGGNRMHHGVDIAAPSGTPIRNAVAGRVTRAMRTGGGGNTVYVQGVDGRQYRYLHMNRIDVKEGDTLAAGTNIGTVGSTGTATGPHLHFEIRDEEGNSLDPDEFLSAAQTGDVSQQGAPSAPSTDTNLDVESRMRESIQAMPDYAELYGKKPAGVTEEEYAGAFAATQTELLGAEAPLQGMDAIRAGLRAGTPSVTSGQIVGNPGSMNNRTFRERLFETASNFNRLV